MTKLEMIAEAIKSLGYKSIQQEEDCILIRFQMKTLQFSTTDNDSQCVRVSFPHFEEVKEGEEALMLAACNKITRDLAVVKVYIDSTFTGVTASCDFYYDGMESLKYNIEQSLEMLGIIRSQFNPIKAELENI